MTAPTNQYCVNYFPINNGGYQMWSSYNGPQYQTDMQTAKRLGFNTIRVILAATGGVFNFGTPTAGELANLTDFYKRAQAVGINIHLTLFDYWGCYGQITASKTWISAILHALPNTANIAVIELQNETRYASTSSYTGGFDAGWPSGTPEYSTVGQVATTWAKLMVPYIRSIAPGIPITSSTSYGTADLSAYLAAVKNTSAAPNWYDWHCYTGAASLVYSALQQVIAIVGSPAMLYIGETGLGSAPAGTQGTLQAQQAQSDYIQAIRWSCAQLGLAEPAPWILFDMNSSAQFPGGQTYGLCDTSGNVKLAAQMYQAIPPGGTVPAISLNGNMQGNQPDSLGNALPVRWSLYRGNSGAQPINAAIDNTNPYQGNPAILLTGSAGTAASDNVPALQSYPYTFPLVSPGQTFTFTCALKAAGSYGGGNSPFLEMAWYNSSGSYISVSTGPKLTLSNTFARYSVSAAAPAGSAYATLLVNVGYNAGSIWVSGATWASSAANRIVAQDNRIVAQDNRIVAQDSQLYQVS
jgi:hypothetical protein